MIYLPFVILQVGMMALWAGLVALGHPWYALVPFVIAAIERVRRRGGRS